MTIPKVTIYTDGACSGNPGPGGWGALLEFAESSREIFSYEIHTTNNRMEMVAAIEALKTLDIPYDATIYTDSKYLQLGVTQWVEKWIRNNWQKSDNKPIKNMDLWRELYNQIQKHKIVWSWIKGHANNKGNIIADKLALKGKEIAIKSL